MLFKLIHKHLSLGRSLEVAKFADDTKFFRMSKPKHIFKSFRRISPNDRMGKKKFKIFNAHLIQISYEIKGFFTETTNHGWLAFNNPRSENLKLVYKPHWVLTAVSKYDRHSNH